MMSSDKNGFTLVELLVTVVIIVIISGVIISTNSSFASQTLLRATANDFAFALRLAESFARSNELTEDRTPIVFEIDFNNFTDDGGFPVAYDYRIFTFNVDESNINNYIGFPNNMKRRAENIRSIMDFCNIEEKQSGVVDCGEPLPHDQLFKIDSGSQKAPLGILDVCYKKNGTDYQCIINAKVPAKPCSTLSGDSDLRNKNKNRVIFMTLRPPENHFRSFDSYIYEMGDNSAPDVEALSLEEISFCIGDTHLTDQVRVRLLNLSGQILIENGNNDI